MPDPLSLAASIAGIIALADLVFKSSYKFFNAVKDAKSDIQTLADEINSLNSLLRPLEMLADQLEAEDGFDPVLRMNHLHACETTLQKLRSRVKKAIDDFEKSKAKGLVRRLKWPFAKSETKEILQELSHHKATITVALTADSMRKLQSSLTKTDEISKHVSEIKEVVEKIEISTRIVVEDAEQKILDFFLKTNPQLNLNMSIRLRQPLTGLWLTGSPQFTNWLTTPGSKLWLDGIPGAGKTILAGSTIQEAIRRSRLGSNIATAFFFCDYKNPQTWDTVNILGAIASQLALQRTEAWEILRDYHTALHPEKSLPQPPDPGDIRAKISKMTELFDQTIIIVDGLDECGVNTDDVVDSVCEVAELSERVSMALFSRDHPEIRTKLPEDFENIQIKAQTQDIQRYVGAQVDHLIQTKKLQLSDPTMKEEITETLVGRADGMFRWVSCQLDYLCNCAHDEERRDAMKKLPRDLPESYRRLLERLDMYSPIVKTTVQKCLQFIAFAKPPLTIPELLQALSTPETIGAYLREGNTYTEDNISRWCSSLIRKSEGHRYLEFAHFSVQEFLEDQGALSPGSEFPNLSGYFISESKSRSLLAEQCLRFLQLRNFDRQRVPSEEEWLEAILPHVETFPFYKYSARQWMEFTKDGLDDPAVLDLAKSLFHPSKTAQFSVWVAFVLEEIELLSSGDYSKGDNDHCMWAFDESLTPLHVAAGFNIPEICCFLLDQGLSTKSRSRTYQPIDFAVLSWRGVLLPPLVELEDPSDLDNVHLEFFWPSAQQRNNTIECLLERSENFSNRDFGNEITSLSAACHIGAAFGDVTPVTQILAAGAVPKEADFKRISAAFELTDITGLPLNRSSVEEKSIVGLLQYLNSAAEQGREWASRMASIVWAWAISERLPCTNDTFLVSSRISMSEETLVAKMRSAISNNDTRVVKLCLADGRLNKSAPCATDGHTFLSMAVLAMAFEVFELLLDEGCDPSVEGVDGHLPIHHCHSLDYWEVIEELWGLGFALSTPNCHGDTLWHRLDEHRATFRELWEKLFDLDPGEAAKAMLTKNTNGHTPLSLILINICKYSNLGEQEEENACYLVKMCSRIPDFWQNHDPILHAAAGVNSEKLLCHVLETGVIPEPAGEGICTALHKLSEKATLPYVQKLLGIYGEDALKYEFEGELPVESYILSVRMFRDLDTEVIEPLIPRSRLKILGRLWMFLCSLPRKIQAITSGRFGDFEAICEVFLRLGALEDYEEETKKPGVTPFFSGLIGVQGPQWMVPRNILRQVLLRTKYWANTKESSISVQYLKMAILQCHLPVVEFLLEHGVDLHQRAEDGESAIESACNGDRAAWICAREGKALFQKLLDHADGEKLRQHTPDSEGLGLLHRLATSQGAHHVLWLVRELVTRGVDINGLTRGKARNSVLVHHLLKRSFQSAELLLELGADPALCPSSTENPWNAAMAATCVGNAGFLKKILEHTTANGLTFDWARKLAFRHNTSKVIGNQKGVDSLHLAAAANPDCLNFYLDNGFLSVNTSRSTEGFTPLHISSALDNLKTMEVLLSRGSDVMAENVNGKTPLHLAATSGSLPAVELLLEHGASESLDKSGKFPRSYAAECDNTEIVQRLTAVSKKQWPSLFQQVRMPARRIRFLSRELEDAIKDRSVEKIQILLAEGCPIDLPLSSCNGCTPLIKALRQGNLEIATFLLQHKASVMKSVCTSCGLRSTAIEIVAVRQDLCSLWPDILRAYHAQGGCLVSGDDYPVHHAVYFSNNEGLKALLDSLRDTSPSFADRSQASPDQAIATICNRLCPHRFGWKPGNSALHIAVEKGNKEVASLLFKFGAKIDLKDDNGHEPITCARTADMAKHLIQMDASTAPSLRWYNIINWLPAQELGQLCSSLSNDSPQSLGLLRWLAAEPSILRLPLFCYDPVRDWAPQDFLSLSRQGSNLVSEDDSGRSLMHCIICREDMLMTALANDCGLTKTSPFPWHLQWHRLEEVAFLKPRFLKHLQRLPGETFLRILNLEPQRGWSPLCLAAFWGLTNTMEAVLSVGAQIDFEGSPLGSATMAASAAGQLEAVKLLVRRNAAVQYIGKNGTRSCLSLAGAKKIIQWLLVGRFTEQLLIGGCEKDRATQAQQECFWSGIAQARLVLSGRDKRQLTESGLDYAKRLSGIKKGWRGRIVPRTEDGLTYPLHSRERKEAPRPQPVYMCRVIHESVDAKTACRSCQEPLLADVGKEIVLLDHMPYEIQA